MLDAPDRESLLADDSFDERVFTGLTLPGADLGGKEFTGCTFVRCKLQETSWRRARLEGCKFDDCDLTRAVPRGMVALDVRFEHCKLMGVEWADLGQFPQLHFSDCVLDFASFVGLSLRSSRFINCKITEANFLDSDLRATCFAGSDMSSAILRGCKLDRDTDLGGVTGLLLDPATNQARGVEVPIDSAALLAMHLGLRVTGYSTPSTRPSTPSTRPSTPRARARR